MKKFGIIIFIVALFIGVAFASLFSFGRASGNLISFSFGNAVHGSGVAATEIRDVGEFEGVDVGGVFDVEIVAGKDFEVKIEADDNLMQYIETEVRGGVLKISSSSHRLKFKTPLRVRVSAPNIESVEATGASKVSLSALQNSDLRIDTSGASRVKLEGATRSLSVEVSGASHVDAEALKAENATVGASGASGVDVYVTGNLISTASGASKIAYTGNPAVVEKKSSGASKVYQK
jgi:hypothetical protein